MLIDQSFKEIEFHFVRLGTRVPPLSRANARSLCVIIWGSTLVYVTLLTLMVIVSKEEEIEKKNERKRKFKE